MYLCVCSMSLSSTQICVLSQNMMKYTRLTENVTLCHGQRLKPTFTLLKEGFMDRMTNGVIEYYRNNNNNNKTRTIKCLRTRMCKHNFF